VVTTYKEQGGVERGFRFLKDPLFLASSVFVKKAERIIALPSDHGPVLDFSIA
jgi:transposase